MKDDKYLLVKVVCGTVIEDSFFIVPGKDPAAVKAMQAYAAATDNKARAEAIYRWVGRPDTTTQTLEQVVRERDAIFEHYVFGKCTSCIYGDLSILEEPCVSCIPEDKKRRSHFVWTGLPEQKEGDPHDA